MTIEEQLNGRLKQAMKQRDRRTLDLVRMLKARMTERRTAKGFSGEVNDALWLDVIAGYAKSLKKGIEEFAKADTEAARAQREQLAWEVARLEEFLPAKADDATTGRWIDEAIAGMGGPEKARVGAVMGAVMKVHKADVDAALVRRLVEERLG